MFNLVKLLDNKDVIKSVDLISESTIAPTLVVRFIDGTETFIKMKQGVNLEDIVLNELKIYNIKQRKNKINEILKN